MIRRGRDRVVKGIVMLAAWIGIALTGMSGTGLAADQAVSVAPSREYLVKAAFLYNFAKFTEWPGAAFADPAAPLRVCVLGEDPFGAALKSIEGKRIRGRRVVTTRLARVDDGGQCQVLFISASEERRLDGILERIDGRPVLTVADMPNFSQEKGIIGLRTVAARVRFDVNLDVAVHAGLSFSSKLLVLADGFTKTGQPQLSSIETDR